jgi:hypothetical protein
MKLYSELSLSSFEFWSGAKDNAEQLTDKELDEIEVMLEDTNPDGMSETELNDLFWFDFETVVEWIGKEVCENCGELIESGETCECQEDEEEIEEEDEEETEEE